MLHFIACAAFMVAFFVYTVYFIKNDRLLFKNHYIANKVFKNRKEQIKKMIENCNDPIVFEKVFKYFYDFLFEPYRESAPHLPELHDLQAKLTEKSNDLRANSSVQENIYHNIKNNLWGDSQNESPCMPS